MAKRSKKLCGGCGGEIGDGDRCVRCVAREHELTVLHENIRRLKGWAKQEGTRRRLAEALAKECDKYEPKSQAHHRWALIWEMTGANKELRKLVERLMPHWGTNVRVIDPIMGRTADVLQNGH